MDARYPPLRFSILGTFEVRGGAATIDIGPHKQRLLLATLLCRVNTTVSVDQLIDAVWEESPPRTARKNLQAYVSMLRKVVGDRLAHTGYGYVVRCGPDELDLVRFEALAEAGRRAAREGSIRAAAEILGEALRLWRGPFLADVAHSSFLAAEAARMRDRRLRVCEDWADAAGRLGDHREVLEVVDELADQHPERERLTAAKLTALVGCGRRQEALAYYEAMRRSLAEHLGLDPSPTLQRLFRAILAGDPMGGPAHADDGSAISLADRRPGQDASFNRDGDPLPRDIPDFTGRDHEIGTIVNAWSGLDTDRAAALITGPVGVGKSALAVRVARLLAERFPDGRVYVPMRDANRRPRELSDVLAALCAAVGLDLPDHHTPEAATAWRAWMSRRRTLIVMDDACDASVVRSLLPGSGPSRVLVTSRYRLSGLESALRVELGELAHDEAVKLIAQVAGLDAVLGGYDRIISYLAHSGRSPLAVRILAGRLRELPGPPLRLGTAVERPVIDQLVLGDLDVARRYREHCEELTAGDRQVLAALVRGARPPFDRTVIAELVRESEAGLDRAIESLVEANLLTQPGDDVAAHTEQYEMPVLVYDFVRYRLCGGDVPGDNR